jgi:ABC-type nitrate/sulfonate/bicarbonate transport system substrate-binding protein
MAATRRGLFAGSGASLALAVTGRCAFGQSGPALKVMVFPGMTNFPIFVSQQQGLFAKHGLTVELLAAPNSDVQRNGLANGELQIIHTAADNPVAMVELARQDAIIVTGGDNGFNHVVVQPEIGSLADVRGKTVVVDAPNTAFALLLYKALKNAGLNKGDYAIKSVGGTPQRLAAMKDKSNVAGIIGLPFYITATASGLKDAGSATSLVGAYQADCVTVMRGWAKANGDTLVRYIQAMIEARRWLLDPPNKTAAVALLVERLKLSREVAERAYTVVTDPKDGMAKDARFDRDGFNNVLKLRAEIEGQWGGQAPSPDKYVDLSYYDKALAGL